MPFVDHVNIPDLDNHYFVFGETKVVITLSVELPGYATMPKDSVRL